MENILAQIEKYHQFCIWCFIGMILCGFIAVIIYRKTNMKEVFAYYRRKKKKLFWMIVVLGVLFCMPTTFCYATEGTSEEETKQPEEVEDVSPVLEQFSVGKQELLMEYKKEYVPIFICIRDEQATFDAKQVLLEYRITDSEIWSPIVHGEQPWNNPEDNLFETTYEFSGVDKEEKSYEFRITYVDATGNPMILSENVQAETIAGCEGAYLAKKRIVIDQLPPAIEVSYQNEQEEEINSSEDGMELIPYYNAGEEILINYEIKDTYLDFEHTKLSITGTDLKGNILFEEFPELLEGTYQLSLKADGHYVVKAYLVDLAGNENIHEKKFALDHTPPKSPVIAYETESETLLERIWPQLTFGYFSKEKITALIHLEDEISGLKKITYSYQDTELGDIVTQTLEQAELPIEVELPYSFKGNLSVQSEDMLGNQSEMFKDIGVISESEQIHQEQSRATVHVLTKHSKTPDYYAEDVRVKYSAQDSYSGIKEIQYLCGSSTEEIIDYLGAAEIATDLITKEYLISAEENQENEIVIGLSFTDNAGYRTTVPQKELPQIHIDTISPEIRVVYDNYEVENEKYFRQERTATVYVKEKNFDPKDVSFHILGPEVVIGDWSHSAAAGCQANNDSRHTGHSINCVWKCEVKFEADGEYQFGFSCVDLAGNKGNYGNVDEFVIDKTNPVIRVVYDNMDVRNDIYYRAPRIAKVTIFEKNFSSENVDIKISVEKEGMAAALPGVSNWISTGEEHQAVIAYDYDAKFTFDIAYTDLAGNVAEDYSSDYFCVDLTSPQIVLTEIADKSANNGRVSPVITVSDTNYDTRNTWMEIVGWGNGLVELEKTTEKLPNGEEIHIRDFEYIPEMDDLYRLSVGATDLAGNVSETKVSFSVNRFGSVYTLDEETEKMAGKGGDYYTNIEKDLIITETNVDTLEFLEIICNHNGKVRTLLEGKDYIVHKSGVEIGWKQYQYQIFGKNFEDDGHYTITIYSEDRAKNVSDNQSKGKEISFAVDKTSPSIVFSGVEQLGRYRENSRQILFDIQDNLAIKKLTVVLDGNAAVYDSETLNAANGKVSIVVKWKNDWQTLHVFAEDQAGNQSSIKEITFLITPNLWIQFYHHKTLFYGSIILLGAAGIIAGIYMGSRKKKFFSS